MAVQPVKISACPVNVMSKAMFRKLRQEKYKFFTAEMVSVTIEDVKFCGNFTAKLIISKKSSNAWAIATFYVEEGSFDTVFVTNALFEKLASSMVKEI